MKISIVIPNWNGEEKLKNTLPKVLEVKGINEIIIVDDASTDRSIEVIESFFPKVILIRKEENSGFSTTANLGVKHAQGELVFLLNTDATPAKDCLKFIIPHFKNPKVFSVGCNTGGNWSWAKFEKGFFWHYMVEGKIETVHQTLWASGGSGVFRKKIWEELRGFDEMYNPFYEEDLDLGYRATKRGYINLWEPKAKVEHQKDKGVIAENFSKSQIHKIAQRNQLMFIWKNITSKKMINKHKSALLKMLLFHPSYFLIFLAAFLKIKEVIRKRKVEKKEAKLTDEEILNKFKVDF